MVIRLGQGFWVDASDGQNWDLNRDRPELKHHETLGYCSSLARAMRLALEHGLHECPADTPISGLDDICEQIASDILSEVVIEKVNKKDWGKVKRFTPKHLYKPRRVPKSSGMTQDTPEAA